MSLKGSHLFKLKRRQQSLYMCFVRLQYDVQRMPSFILPRASLQCNRRLCCCQLNKHWFLTSCKLIRSIGYHVLLIVIGLWALSSGYITFSRVFFSVLFALRLSNKFIASNVLTCFANFHSKRQKPPDVKFIFYNVQFWLLCRKRVLHHHHLILHKLVQSVWY